MAWLVMVVLASIVWSVWAFRNRNSRPRIVVRVLEKVWQQLKTAHGMKDFYEGSEVAAALRASSVTDDDIVPFAYARYCRETDFLAQVIYDLVFDQSQVFPRSFRVEPKVISLGRLVAVARNEAGTHINDVRFATIQS